MLLLHWSQVSSKYQILNAITQEDDKMLKINLTISMFFTSSVSFSPKGRYKIFGVYAPTINSRNVSLPLGVTRSCVPFHWVFSFTHSFRSNKPSESGFA